MATEQTFQYQMLEMIRKSTDRNALKLIFIVIVLSLTGSQCYQLRLQINKKNKTFEKLADCASWPFTSITVKPES